MTNPERVREFNDQPVAGGFEIPELPEWFQEPGADNYYRPWQHTPLDPYSAEVRGHQAELRESFEKLADTAPASLAMRGLETLVRLDFMSGMITREAQSAANFHDWVNNHAEELLKLQEDPEAAWLLGEGLAGHGSARGQLELLCRAPSLRSLDLQVLSTPFGYRRQYVEQMHRELHDALQDMDASIYDEPQWLENHPPKVIMDPSRNIHLNADGKALLVTYKRKVAEVADPASQESTLSVLEREAWLVLTDLESGFSQDILQEIQRSPSWAQSKPTFMEYVTRYVMGRVERGQEVIPLSIATYASRRIDA